MDFKINDTVYIKSYYEKSIYREYIIKFLNKEYAILGCKCKTNCFDFKKIPLKHLTKEVNKIEETEQINKGDFVKCIIDNIHIEEGVVIETYKNFVLVLIGLKRKKVSKNRVIVLNN